MYILGFFRDMRKYVVSLERSHLPPFIPLLLILPARVLCSMEYSVLCPQDKQVMSVPRFIASHCGHDKISGTADSATLNLSPFYSCAPTFHCFHSLNKPPTHPGLIPFCSLECSRTSLGALTLPFHFGVNFCFPVQCICERWP